VNTNDIRIGLTRRLAEYEAQACAEDMSLEYRAGVADAAAVAAEYLGRLDRDGNAS
jgi:hypothetical protein